MLSLDSPRWRELSHAYGSAADVPATLRALDGARTVAEREPVWFDLWSALCHQGDVYTASYAATPHLVAVAARLADPDWWQPVHLVACIEAYRHRENAPELEPDLVPAYEAALARLSGVICAHAGEPWDEALTRAMAGALAVAQGHARLGLAITDLDAEVECPMCGAAFAPPGWELDR